MTCAQRRHTPTRSTENESSVRGGAQSHIRASSPPSTAPTPSDARSETRDMPPSPHSPSLAQTHRHTCCRVIPQAGCSSIPLRVPLRGGLNPAIIPPGIGLRTPKHSLTIQDLLRPSRFPQTECQWVVSLGSKMPKCLIWINDVNIR